MTRACIVGWAHTPFGKLEDPDVESLIARVSGEALTHAGVAASEVDGIYVGVMNTGFSKQGFEGSLVALNQPDLAHVPSTHLENACATGSAALYAALDFVDSGRGRIALVVGAEKMTAKSVAETGDILLGASYRKEEAEIEGGEGHDRLFAGRGGAELSGGGDDDCLFGCTAAADVFKFDLIPFGHDRIVGFENGRDRIEIPEYLEVEGLGDIEVSQRGSATRLSFAEGIIDLAGFDANLIDASDFHFL